MAKLIIFVLLVLCPPAFAARLFTDDYANHLDAAVSVASTRATYTIGVWMKRQTKGYSEGGPDQYQCPLGVGPSAIYSVDTFALGATGGGANIDGGDPTDDVWELYVYIIDGGDAFLYLNATQVASNSGQGYGGILTSDTNLTIGSNTGQTLGKAKGSIAHAFGFKRVLSGAEITALLTDDPDTLDPTGRLFHFRMDDAGLTNTWSPSGGDTVGSLSVTGTVAWDTDSPYAAGANAVPVIQHHMHQQAKLNPGVNNRRYFLAALGASALYGASSK